MKSCWKKIKLTMKKSLPDHSYRMWIQPIQFIEIENNVIKLSCSNFFSKNRIKTNYLTTLETQFKKHGYKSIKIELTVENKRKKINSASKILLNKNSQSLRQKTLPGLNIRFDSGRMLKKDYTFNDFVVGDNNNFAYHASLGLAKGANNGNKALYLLSGTGLGKSHLSQSIGHYIMSQNFSEKIYYVTAEEFTNEMVCSIKNNTINAFKEKYRKKCDVFIIEDIHFLSGKNATQKELAMTLDYLMDADKKIVFSGCYIPDDIPKMNEQLKSRLSVGLVTEIEAPDFKTRVRILKKKVKSKGYKISREVIDYIAQELCDNVRQLENGLISITTKANILGEEINISFARNVLLNISRRKKKITIDIIKKFVCKEFNISEQTIVSASRKKNIVKPRQMAIFLARKYTDQPLKIISKNFNRYHATAIYSINAVEKELKQKGVFFQQMNYLYKKIENGKV
ncbi:MAG: chromosomal replication initiator protein DnaA [Desulfobacteraceae bacterium 4572_130]|nr:MAG: chromosomal replication initiator protein DnaA [Desulfobacteraceae bacterium 4572_130]